MAQITLNSSGVASSGALVLQSNGTTTAVTIDTSQNVSAVGSLGTTISSKTAEFNAAGGSIYSSYNDGTKTWRTGVGIFAAGQFSIRNATDSLQAIDITSAGNVGIGTASPTEKLDVSGAISTTSNAANFNQAKTTLDYASGAGRIAAYISTGSNLQFYTNPNAGNVAERMRIDSSGNLLVGKTVADTTSVGWHLTPSGVSSQVFTISSGTNEAFIYNNTSTGGTARVDFRTANVSKGNIQWNNTNTAYNTTSDYRLKEDVQPMTGALAKVAALKPCTYKWKVDGSDGQGFIAHELAEVEPGCVTGEKDAVDADGKPQYQGIDTSFLVATLTAAIQELKAIVDAQAVEIAALKGTA